MIELFDINELIDEKISKFAITTAENAIHLLKLPMEVDVSISIVTEDEIRELNEAQRKINKVTDVLSFPMLFFEKPMEEEAFTNIDPASINPETNRVFLGDVIICYQRAKEQAEEYGHSLNREIAFLIVHSLLHLVGYDHMTEQEEKQMFDCQNEILSILNITR